jgi:hypothetical protein
VDGSSNVFVTDYDGAKILKYTSSGTLITSWGSLWQPVDTCRDGSGDVFLVELGGQRVQKFTTSGTPLAVIGNAGTGAGSSFRSPSGSRSMRSGRIYVADAGRVRILRFLADGTFDMEFTPPGPPYDMAIGPDGNIYVVRYDANQVYQLFTQRCAAAELQFTGRAGWCLQDRYRAFGPDIHRRAIQPQDLDVPDRPGHCRHTLELWSPEGAVSVTPPLFRSRSESLHSGGTMRTRFLLLAAAGLLLPGVALPAAPAGWNLAGNDPASFQVSRDATVTHDGKKSASLESIPGAQRLRHLSCKPSLRRTIVASDSG